MVVSIVVCAGCQGEIVEAAVAAESDLPRSGPTQTYSGTAGADSDAPGTDAGTPTSTARSCPTTPTAAPAPLARLTNLEYQNTLRDLLPTVHVPAVTLPSDIVVEGFDNNAKAQTPSAALIEQYRSSAQAIAAAVVAQLDDVLPCEASTSAQQDSCGPELIRTLLPRAYRRPVSAEELTRYDALFSSAKAAYGFPNAIGMVVQAALQSPSFLYRIELGGSAAQGLSRLSGYELASRLSYFFWDTMPDDTLLAAAESGELDDVTGIETQARRLLADPRAHAAVANLFYQWLRLDKLTRMPKSAELFPDWNDQVAESLRKSTSLFLERAFWERGTLGALLTDSESYVDQNIAPLYGVTAAASGEMTLLQTDERQRSGILTQAGLLAAFAHETHDSPVLRGVFVLDRLLCSTPPPPPPGVTGSITETTASAGPMTTRDRIALTHEQGDCASCHHSIDGIGFGFSHYDAVGRWRETEQGLTVNAKGWLVNTRDVDGDFDGVVELGQKLAQSTQVNTCVASQWYRYALGLGAADVDKCALAPVVSAFGRSDGDLQALMLATVTSDAFRNRPEVTP